MDIKKIETLLETLPQDDESVKELKRILMISDSSLSDKGLRSWLIQYRKEAAVKPFLSILAHALALYLLRIETESMYPIRSFNDIQGAFENHAQNTGKPVPKLIAQHMNDPHPPPAIKAFIKSLNYRFTRTGFTGAPHSQANLLWVQLAFLCVDLKPDWQAELWKILYPEIITVYDGNDNMLWPLYGHALLVKNIKGEFQSRLINYDCVYRMAQTEQGFERLKNDLAPETLKRIYRFYPGHKEFWVKLQNGNLPVTTHQNYLQFFTALQTFLYKNRYAPDNTYDPITGEVITEDEIAPTAQAIFWTEFAPFMRGFLNYIATEGDSYKRKLNDLMCDKETKDARLFGIIDVLLNPPQVSTNAASCFQKNQQYLKIILSNPDRCEVLEQIPIHSEVNFNKELFASGVDNLSAVLIKTQLAQDKKTLLEIMNRPYLDHDIKPEISDWVAEYKHVLGGRAYTAKVLHDFLYEVQDKEQRVEFLKTLLGDPLDFSLLLPDRVNDYTNFANRIIDSHPELYQTNSLIPNCVSLALKKVYLNNVMRLSIFLLNQANLGFDPMEIFSNNHLSGVSDNFLFPLFKIAAKTYSSNNRFKNLVAYYAEDLYLYFGPKVGDFVSFYKELDSDEKRSIFFDNIKPDLSSYLNYREPLDPLLSLLVFSTKLDAEMQTQIQIKILEVLKYTVQIKIPHLFTSNEMILKIFDRVNNLVLRRLLYEMFKEKHINRLMAASKQEIMCFQAVLPEYDFICDILLSPGFAKKYFPPPFVFDLLHEEKKDTPEFLMRCWAQNDTRLDYLISYVPAVAMSAFLKEVLKCCAILVEIERLLGHDNRVNNSWINQSLKLGHFVTVGIYIRKLIATSSQDAVRLAFIPDENLLIKRTYDIIMENRSASARPMIFMFHPRAYHEDSNVLKKVQELAKLRL